VSWNIVIEGRFKTGPAAFLDVRFAKFAFTTKLSETPADTFVPALILSEFIYKKTVNPSTSGGKDASLAIGRLELIDDGSLAPWLDYDMDQQPWAAYLVEIDKDWADRILVAKFRGKLAPERASAGVVVLNFTDRMGLLDKPVGSTYPDTISNTQLRGSGKPVVIGKVFQAPCYQPETTGNVRFDVHDGVFKKVLAVRDQGVLRVPDTQWRPDGEAAIQGFELLTARGGTVTADVEGALLTDLTEDELGGDGTFTTLTPWTVLTDSGELLHAWNPADTDPRLALSNNDRNAEVTTPDSQCKSTRSTVRISQGLWYWEITRAGTTAPVAGLANTDTPITVLDLYNTTEPCFGWRFNSAQLTVNGLVVAQTQAITGNTMRFALRVTSTGATVWVGDSSGWLNGSPSALTGGQAMGLLALTPALNLFQNGDSAAFNAAAVDLLYGVPAGFSALQTPPSDGIVALAAGGVRIASNGSATAELNHAVSANALFYVTVTCTAYQSGTLEIHGGLDVMRITGLGAWTGTIQINGSGQLRIRKANNVLTDLTINTLRLSGASATDKLAGAFVAITNRVGLAPDALDEGKIITLSNQYPYKIGIATQGTVSAKSVLRDLMDTYLGWAIWNRQDLLTVGRLEPWDGVYAHLIDETRLTTAIVRKPYRARGLNSVLLSSKNWLPFDLAEIPPVVNGAERALVSAEYRTRSVSVTPIDNGGTGNAAVDRLKRPLEGMTSVIVDDVDAQNELTWRAEIFLNGGWQYDFSFVVEPGDLNAAFAEPGTMIKAQDDDGPAGGNLVSIEQSWPSGLVTMTLLGPAASYV